MTQNSSIYHILNGDALKRKIPKELTGEIIVARECLVDGPIKATNIKELFTIRVNFLSTNYGTTAKEYQQKVITEFRKVMQIPKGSIIHLWFEDDLFCQVNFWFILHLIQQNKNNYSLYLVRPPTQSLYSFGDLTEEELIKCYQQRTKLCKQLINANLWTLYQNNELTDLKQLGNELKEDYPFIPLVIQAHIDRIPTETNIGRPIETLKKIINELQTDDFRTIFKEFNRREPIYGFGDLQVKRLITKTL